MIELVATVGAILSWLGASVLVLSDGRRGLALGLLLSAVGLAILLAETSLGAAGLVAVGGLITALLRLRDGVRGWGLLPEGSTPRLILCLVAGGAAAYAGVLLGPEGEPWLLTGALAAAALGVARLLGSEQRQASLACAALISLSLAALESAVGTAPATAGALLATLGACLLSLIPAGSVERAA